MQTDTNDTNDTKYSKNNLMALAICLISGVVLLVVLLILNPSEPIIPNYKNLKTMQGVFTTQIKSGDKLGTYYIDDNALECPAAIRLYPYASCPMTIEIKAAEQKVAKAYWYTQSFMGLPYAMLVELIVDKNNTHLDLKGIKVLEYQASKEIIQKLHQQRLQIYKYAASTLAILYFLVLAFCVWRLMREYRIQKNIKNS